MSHMRQVIRAGVFVMCASLLCVAAAAQDQTRRAEDAARDMLKLQRQITKLTNQVDRVVASLAVVASPGSDPVQTFESFEQAVKDTRKFGKDAQDTAKEAAEKRTKFSSEWDRALQKIQDPDLRKAAEDRRASLTPLVDAVLSSFDAANTSAAPFMQSLNDMVLLLEQDLSAQGIIAAAPEIEKFNAAAAQVKKDLTASAAAIGALSAVFTTDDGK